MSGAHTHELDPGTPLDGPLERLAPEAKVAGAVAFLVAVVATPASAWWAWAADAAVAGALAVAALVPGRTLARRLVFELPLLALAAAMVVAGSGPRVAVAGVALSRPGLLAAWTMLSRATLGVVVASVLVATTTPAELLVALARLRVPPLLRSLAALGLRYLAVLRAELDRVRLAQQLRCPDGRRLRPADVAGVAAALLVRSYERGERVEWARAGRGGGPLGGVAGVRAPVAGPATWLVALLPALIAGLLAVVAAVAVAP